jgi:hypothetical protein
MSLPLIPHSDFGVDCCGCLVEVSGEEREFHCNECGAVIPAADVYRAVMEMESCDATCPHCGRVNEINGFSDVSAFVCRFCGEGVTQPSS